MPILIAIVVAFLFGVLAGLALAITLGRRIGNQRKVETRRTMASIDAVYAEYERRLQSKE